MLTTVQIGAALADCPKPIVIANAELVASSVQRSLLRSIVVYAPRAEYGSEARARSLKFGFDGLEFIFAKLYNFRQCGCRFIFSVGVLPIAGIAV